MDDIVYIQTKNGVQRRSMFACICIIIGVLSVTQRSFSRNLNCTKLTTSCPTADQWLERGKLFNCPGNRRYVCLNAPRNELREGCIFNYTIQAGRIGCPYTKECDIRTGQPVLVTENYYLPCPPESTGCPSRNHPGYSILEIYRYARCQGRNTSDESSVSPDKVTGTGTPIAPNESLQCENWTLNILYMALGLGFIFIIVFVMFIEKHYGCSKCQKAGNHFYRKTKGIFNQEELAEKGSIQHEQQPLFQKQENAIPSTTIETDVPHFSKSINKTVLKKKDVRSLRHTQYSSSHDSDSSHTPLESSTGQQTFPTQSSHKQHPESSCIKSDQDTDIYKAVSDGKIEKLKELIDAKANVNAKTFFQDTPLHEAASNGQIDIVKILIDAKADVNAKDVDQITPLHRAVSKGHIDIVRILIDAKADVNVKGPGNDTLLHKAASYGHNETVKILINANVEVNAKSGDTPLHKAASNGHSDTATILIDAKADVNAVDWNLDTPLHKATEKGHINTVKILIDAKADANATNWYKDTPLHKTASNGHCDAVIMLIDAKADVNAKNGNQDTPLHKAALNGHSDIMKMLIDAKSDVNAKGWYQETPLHRAATKGHADILNILIDARAEVNDKDSMEDTPLHKATLNGHTDIVRMLIDAKSHVNAKGWNGKTPLHLAAEFNQSDIIKILLEANADVNAQDKNNKTPLDLAEDRGKADIFKAFPCADVIVNENGKV